MPTDIQPLSPKLLPDWLNFFDNIAFVDNPDWSDCYCCCYQLECTNQEWGGKNETAKPIGITKVYS